MLFAKTSLTVKQLISQTLVLYRASLPPILIVSMISAAIVTFINHLQRVSPGFTGMDASKQWTTVLIAILSVVVVCYAAIIMMHQIMSVGRGERVALSKSIGYAHPRLLKLTMAMVVVYFVTAVGMVLLILPGIFVMVMTSMVMPLIIFKQLGPFEAFKASFELVWGNFWRTLGVIIVPNAAIFVVVSIARMLHFPADYFTVLEAVVMWLAGPWVYCAILTMYNELMIIHYNQGDSE